MVLIPGINMSYTYCNIPSSSIPSLKDKSQLSDELLNTQKELVISLPSTLVQTK